MKKETGKKCGQSRNERFEAHQRLRRWYWLPLARRCSCGRCVAPTSQEMLVEKLICHYSACKAELLRFADVTERIHAPWRYTQRECSVIFESYVSGSTRVCVRRICTYIHIRERTYLRRPLARSSPAPHEGQVVRLREARDKSMPLRLDAGTE